MPTLGEITALMLPEISLRPQTDAERADFAERQVQEVARQHENAGEWSAAEAPSLARAQCRDLLADVLREAGHMFYMGIDPTGARVGWLWVAPPPASIEAYAEHDLSAVRWLAQITVAESLRGRGYGLALLEALHRRLAGEGVVAIYLRVYDWNEVARRLYARCGYEVVRQFATDAHMRRRLVS
ncbi:MAG: GNAT family N-acetyltransferase [Chloroflexi bacterium]|nr:GNAT family N-acetyltransferase [Chloroflexota bacterium]